MAVIRYLVEDVDAAVAFYVDALDFERLERWGPAFAMVRRADLTLWLSGPGSSASRPLADGTRPGAGGWNRLVIETADLDAAIARLERAGARFRGDVVTGPGGRQALVDDPSGNPVELFEAARS